MNTHEQLSSIDGKLSLLQEQLVMCRIDIAKLQVKSKIWGAIAGGMMGLLGGAIGVLV